LREKKRNKERMKERNNKLVFHLGMSETCWVKSRIQNKNVVKRLRSETKMGSIVEKKHCHEWLQFD